MEVHTEKMKDEYHSARVGENSARNFGPFEAAKFWNSGKF